MTLTQIKEQIDGITDDINGLSTTLDSIRSGITKTVSTEVTKALADRGIGELSEVEDKIVDDIVAKIVERKEIKAVLLRMETFEKELERVEDSVRKEKKEDEHTRQFGAFIQAAQSSGFNMGNMPVALRDYMHSAEYRALTETVLVEGGFFVPPDIENELLKDVHEYSDIRQIARVTTTTRKDYILFRRTTIPAATWEDEEGTGTDDQPAYVKVEIPCHPTIVKIPITMDLLDDSVINIRAEITADAVLAFAIAEGIAFVSGDAVGKPEGFMTNADVATVPANETVANHVEGDDYYDLYFALAKPYRGRGTFVLNSLTLRNTMKLKGLDGQYVWQNSFQAGVPPTIIGRPYLVAEDMDDDGTNLNYPIAFGDFMRGYRVVDRSGLFLLFDQVTAFPLYRFIWRRRLGGGVTQPEAIVKLLL